MKPTAAPAENATTFASVIAALMASHEPGRPAGALILNHTAMETSMRIREHTALTKTHSLGSRVNTCTTSPHAMPMPKVMSSRTANGNHVDTPPNGGSIATKTDSATKVIAPTAEPTTMLVAVLLDIMGRRMRMPPWLRSGPAQQPTHLVDEAPGAIDSGPYRRRIEHAYPAVVCFLAITSRRASGTFTPQLPLVRSANGSARPGTDRAPSHPAGRRAC